MKGGREVAKTDRFPNLWAAFKEQKRTLGRVAKQIHMNQTTLSKKMKGITEFTLEEMLALQFVLGGQELEYLFADPAETEKAISRVDS